MLQVDKSVSYAVLQAMKRTTIVKLVKTTLMLRKRRIILVGRKAMVTRVADVVVKVRRVDKVVARAKERKEKAKRLNLAPTALTANPS